MFLNTVLVVLTDLAAHFLGNSYFRQHFHLLLSAMLMLGPGLSFWVSQIFLHSGWGWTCIFVGSFVFVLSFTIRRSLSLSLRHLSRLLCYEPLAATSDVSNGQPLLVLREGESRALCLRAGMLWRGYEVSEDVFLLCLCCLLLAEETAVILFLFCVVLLNLWIFLLLCLLAYFPQFPTQLLGGALGCLSWRVLYQGWYHMGPSWYCPGRPGLGLLNAKSCLNAEEDKHTK
uniref:Fat storage-inducing transmembrane protein 1 n=1 Tax=Neogobius melanostomus TaxID=47308 RepID=A0A8C6V606_9GOBI